MGHWPEPEWFLLYSYVCIDEEMQKILKQKFPMDPKSMVLNILLCNIVKIHNKLFKYKVTVARVIFTAKWKAKKCPRSKEWRNKLNDYVIMAKLRVRISRKMIFFKKNTYLKIRSKIKIKWRKIVR